MFLKTKTAADLAARLVELKEKQTAEEAELNTEKAGRGAAALDGADIEKINARIRAREDTISGLREQIAVADTRFTDLKISENEAAMQRLWNEQQKLCGDIHRDALRIAEMTNRLRDIQVEFKSLVGIVIGRSAGRDVLRLPIQSAHMGWKQAGGSRLTPEQAAADHWRASEDEVTKFIVDGEIVIGRDFGQRHVARILAAASKFTAGESKRSSPAPVRAFGAAMTGQA